MVLMVYKIGLTGGVGSGKSTVAAAFAKLGVATFSADAIGHELSRINQAGYLEIVEAFGTGILQADGELDRQALGDIVFNDKARKSELEAILHPMIMLALHQQAEASRTPYCILDIPLLINTAERDLVDRVLVAHCDRKQRIKRIQQRNNWSLEKINRVMENQVSDEALMQAADDVVDNNGDISALQEQVVSLHERYLELSK